MVYPIIIPLFTVCHGYLMVTLPGAGFLKHPPYVLHQQHEVINGVPEAEKLGITFASQGDRCNKVMTGGLFKLKPAYILSVCVESGVPNV